MHAVSRSRKKISVLPGAFEYHFYLIISAEPPLKARDKKIQLSTHNPFTRDIPKRCMYPYPSCREGGKKDRRKRKGRVDNNLIFDFQVSR